jgi:predicted RecA/RadA family phage recombinase
MAAITVTAAQVAAIFPHKAEVFPAVAGEAITAGAPVALTTSGWVNADANGSGLQQVRGVALNTAGAGQAVDILKRGHLAGATVSSLANDAIIYLSDTVGRLDDSAGTMTVRIGRVVPLSDASATKVIYVDCDWSTVWS